jgi:LacI family transcriptional regulator
MKKILKEGKLDYTAIFAGTDVVAEGAILALVEAGIKVPQDVSVIGCDNIADSQDFMIPLTTMSLRISEVATRAVDLLIKRIDQSIEGEYHCISLIPQLVIRSTTSRMNRK